MRDLEEIYDAALLGEDISSDLPRLEAMLHEATDDDRCTVVMAMAHHLINQGDWATLFSRAEREPNEMDRYWQYLAVKSSVDRVDITQAVPALHRALLDPCEGVRRRVSETLATCHLGQEEHQAVSELLDHEDSEVLEGALDVIGEAAENQDIGWLVGRLRTLADIEGHDSYVRQKASMALSAQCAARDISAFDRLFESKNPYVLAAAFRKWKSIETPQEIAWTRFRRAVGSEDWEVRCAAREALAIYAQSCDITALVELLHSELKKQYNTPFSRIGEALMYHYIRSSDQPHMVSLLTAIDPNEGPPPPFETRSGAFGALKALARQGRGITKTMNLVIDALTEDQLLDLQTIPAIK